MILDDGTTAITLPDDLEWVDEYDWSNILQSLEPTLGGGLVVSESNVTKGRPVTLQSGDSVWTDKSIVDALMVLVNTIDNVYTLTLADARTFNVIFDRTNGLPVEAKPVWRQTVQLADSPYILTLRLMEV